MRSLFRTNYFDVVLNLFTSFGYFQSKNDDLKVLDVIDWNDDFTIKSIEAFDGTIR
jgi:hypothetical protein